MKTSEAITLIDECCYDMGDDLYEHMEGLAEAARVKLDDYMTDMADDNWKIVEGLYEAIEKSNPEYIELMIQYHVNSGDLERLYRDLAEEAAGGAASYHESEICQAIDALLAFTGDDEVRTALGSFIADASKLDFEVIGRMYKIAHTYWNFLENEDVWGVRTNSASVVGNIVVESDLDEKPWNAGYDYVCYKSFNSVKLSGSLSLCVRFKSGEDSKDIIADISLAQYGYCTPSKCAITITRLVEAVSDQVVLPHSDTAKESAKILADTLEAFVPKVKEAMKTDESLSHILPYAA